MFRHLPSTLKLFEALNYDAERWGSGPPETDELYPILEAVHHWQQDLYARLSAEQYEHGPWPASPEQMDALRCALADQKGNYAGDELAYALVRCGCCLAETLDALCAWDRQLFRWRAAGYRATDVLAKFRMAGVAGSPTENDLHELDSWIADPVAALAHYSSDRLADTVLSGRVLWYVLDSDSHDEEFAELFRGLIGLVDPPLNISEIWEEAGDGETSTVKYLLDGVEFGFTTDGFFHPIEDRKVVLAFNELLRTQGRKTRAFRFGGGRAEPYDAASYLVADEERFPSVCAELGIPLYDYSA